MRDSEHLTINISSAGIIKTLAIVAFLAFLYYISDIVVVVLTAIVIASAIEPAIKWFKRYKVHRTLAVIIVYLLIALIAAGFFYFFLPSILSDLSSAVSNLPKYLDSLSVWSPVKTDAITNSVSTVKSLGLAQSFSISDLISNFNAVLSNTTQGFVQTLSLVFGGVLSFLLIIVLSFYFAVQEDGVGKFLRIVLPLRYEDYVLGLWKRSQFKIGRWLQGQILLGVLIGVLVYLGLTILGVPNAMLLGIFAAFCEIIPVFGPILAAIPSTLMALTQSGPTLAILVIGFYIIIHQFENQLIYPLVVKKIVGIPPILVILALIIGFKLAGILGIIIAIPISAVLVEVLDDLEKNKMARALSISALKTREEGVLK